MGEKKKVEVKDLSRPTLYVPENFRLSPTALWTKKKCGQMFFYKYVKKIRPVKESCNLLRGRVVHRVMQLWLMGMVLPSHKEWFNMPARQAVNKVLNEYAKEEKSDNIYEIIQSKYEFPHDPRGFFTWQQFLDQMVAAVGALKDYVKVKGIKPVFINNMPAIECDVTYDMSWGDTIYDTTENKATSIKNIIDLVGIEDDSSVYIYDWKIGLRRYATKHGISSIDINDAMISYARSAQVLHGVFEHWPIEVKVVRAVVNKKGERSEKATVKVGEVVVVGVDEYIRKIEQREFFAFMEESAMHSQDIKNMRLIRNKNEMCITSCEYAKICLRGELSGYNQLVDVDDIDYGEEDE